MRNPRIRKTTQELDAAARRIRRQPTSAEAALWERLRVDRMGGYRFRRQHPVGRSILDFYCAEGRLCIAVDGPIHDQQEERDEARDAWIATHGLRTLRFGNAEALEQIDGVLARIRDALPPLKHADAHERPSPR